MEAYETVMDGQTKRGFRFVLDTPETRYDRWDVEGLIRAQAEITWDKMIEFLKAQKVNGNNVTTTSLYDAFGLEDKLREWNG